MTPLPKRKLSHKRQGKRRASFRVNFPILVLCPACKRKHVSHTLCKNCAHNS